MKKRTAYLLIYMSLGLYLLGGIAIFVGFGMSILMKGMWSGEQRQLDSYGFMFLFAGLGLTIFALVMMRVVRHRLRSS